MLLAVLMSLRSLIILILVLIANENAGTVVVWACRNSCDGIPINYPFGVDDGCGAPQFRLMLNCSSGGGGLFFLTPSGSYKVQSIDYKEQSMTIFDPGMSTCSILQPHHDFLMSDLQSALIPPSPDTVFLLVNCSLDSPVLNHYRSLCLTDLEGHSCDELYTSCTSFKLFHMSSNNGSSSSPPPPPCCFTRYSTLRFMSMNILDCSHYASVYNADRLKGVGPLDWLYGIKLSYAVPDAGCEPCTKSGGTCGFDVETEALLCVCSPALNATTDCAAGTVPSKAGDMACSTFTFLLTASIISVTWALSLPESIPIV